MKDAGYFTYQEITNQTDAWTEALDVVRSEGERIARLWREYPGGQIIFTGCGSTYYLSIAAAALFQELTGEPSRAISGGEMLLNPQLVMTRQRTLLVAMSRSGKTTETIKAVEQFKASGRGAVVVVTNYESPLSEMGDISIVISKGQEESVAQTRSFASLYVAAAAFCAIIAGRDDLLNAMTGLPAIGERLLQQYGALAKDIGADLHFDRFYFLGSGIRYGLACEANLKMKEMTLTHSEPFHFLEFRHGPMSMVNEKAVIVGLISDKNARHEQAVLNEMQAKGGTILALAESGADVSFESGIPESVRGVLYLPILQLMAFYRSLARQLDPDHPNNLEAVVKLDL
jgi:glucosamine--fructose-6-phosphate aminotransferase (isomerizing)